MAKSLVIVESPAKAKTIEKYLGKKFTVKASMGHIVDLPKSQYGVDNKNGFKPKYIKIRGKAKLINELKNSADKADAVYLATDPDRGRRGYFMASCQCFKSRLQVFEANRIYRDQETSG